MATQPAPNVAQIDIRMIKDQQTIQNTFHVFDGTGWDLTKLELLAGVVRSWWQANVKPLLTGSIGLYQIIATDLTSLNGARFVEPLDPPDFGTVAGDSLPANATLAVKLSIGKRGRGRAGRVFWPDLPEGDVTENTVAGAYVTSVLVALNALPTALVSASPAWELSVLHRVVGGIKPPTAASDPVTSVTATDPTVDSQRDRLPGHKRHKKKHV